MTFRHQVALAANQDEDTEIERKSHRPADGKPRCEVCGNHYDRIFEVTMDGATHLFDSFECAIHALAPRCAHCDCRMIGHGVESEGHYYCCEHCARHKEEHVQEHAH